MTHEITLSFEDHDGTLSPLVHEAIEHGATADRDASHVADNTFVLTFKSKKALDSFRAKLGHEVEFDLVDDHSGEPAAD